MGDSSANLLRLRPRFSLLTLLLVTAIIALSITILLLYSELRQLRSEVRRWRDENGALTISDRSKIHAIQIRQNDELSWAWRVWVPEGTVTDIVYGLRDIPKTGLHVSPSSESPLNPGEHIVRFSIRKDPVALNWKSVLEFDRGGSSEPIPSDQQWFLQNGQGQGFAFEGVEYTTKVAEDDGTLLLQRRRAIPLSPAGTMTAADADADVLRQGFMIWLQQR